MYKVNPIQSIQNIENYRNDKNYKYYVDHDRIYNTQTNKDVSEFENLTKEILKDLLEE